LHFDTALEVNRVLNVLPFFVALVLAALASLPAHAQDKSSQPKVVFDLEKQTPADKPYVEKFGKACDRFNQKSEQHGPSGVRSTKPATIIELMGAPIEVVKIRHYGRTWKNQDEVRNRVTKLINTRTSEVYNYEPWAEFVFADIIATVQFSDHSEGALEVSGVHACFSDHSHFLLWLRVWSDK
jgi:hypothetical protein